MSATSVFSPSVMVCAIDPLAVDTALSVLAESGNAVDAAIAANAVLGVTSPNACGVGGDLLAMIAMPEAAPEAMISAGHAGSGASAAELRAEGRTRMPSQGDIRSVTVPGCVDGWFALHARFGTAPISRLLAPAIEIARDGFPATPGFTAAWGEMADMISGSDVEAPAGLVPGGIVRRPQLARTLEAIAAHGRSGFYEGDAGKRLIELGKGLFNGEDLARSTAHFVAPLGLRAWDHTVWTVPAPSQGYVTLVAANIAAQSRPADRLKRRIVGTSTHRVGAPGRSRPARDALGAQSSGDVALTGKVGEAKPDRSRPLIIDRLFFTSGRHDGGMRSR